MRSLLCGVAISDAGAGRAPGGGTFCRRSALCVSCSCTFKMAVAVFCPREECCVASRLKTVRAEASNGESYRPGDVRFVTELNVVVCSCLVRHAVQT